MNERALHMISSSVVNGSSGIQQQNISTTAEGNFSVSNALQTLLTTFDLYSSRPRTDAFARNQYEAMRNDCLNTLAGIFVHYTGSTSSASSDTSTTEEDQRILSLALSLLELHKGEELGRWYVVTANDEICGPENEQSGEVGLWKELKKIGEFRSLVYNDPRGIFRYQLAQHEQLRIFLRFRGDDCWAAAQRSIEEFLNDFGEDLSPGEELIQNIVSFLKRAVAFLASSTGRAMIDTFIQLAQFAILVRMSQVERGLRISVLQELNSLCPTFEGEPGENGYTKTYIGGRKYRISKLRRDFLRRNSAPDATGVGMDVVTVALSYRHFWQNSKKRISQPDFEAIASFIEASRGSRIRFWIDAKLPPTDDGSFERWLRRGIRPYCRYLTLVCPSASEAQGRFWIANEKYLAIAGRGIFYFSGDKIHFDKGHEDFKKLAKLLLKLVIGEEELPPGVNAEDEGKVHQWALGILGSDQNDLVNQMGPKADEIHFPDFDENKAIIHVQNVIREHGPHTLPLIPGRTWNKYNPLMKGSAGEQPHKMVGWIGLVHPDDKKNIYFLHVFLLKDLIEPSVAVLRVRLQKAYDDENGNCIEEKVLMMIESTVIREMHPVAVPVACEWEAFSGTH
ncbi:hypothetical protein FGB62_25g436 [Gracilaria domingensis]|nr:hypothetical protein FGB62_25g436 [Gracilaria domingensis]